MDVSNTSVATECFTETVVQHIERGNNSDVLSILQNANLCLVTDSSGSSVFHYAAKYGNVWLAKYLIGLGTDIDAQNHLKETPLMFAVEGNQIETIKVLLNSNADIFVPDLNGHCALKKAIDNEAKITIECENNFETDDRLQICEDIVEEFENRITPESLNNSRHVQSKVFHADCPLYLFIRLRNAEVTRILLEKGSPVEAKVPETGVTALHLAVQEYDLENIKVLLEYRADINSKTNNGDTPIVNLMNNVDENEMLEIVKVLMAAGAVLVDRDSGMIFVRYLLWYGSKEIIGHLLTYKIDLYFVDRLGGTALYYLVQNKNDVLVDLPDLIIDANSCIEYSHRSMLHYAVANGNVCSVKFLIDRGAKIDVMCSLNFTPLGWLIRSHRNCCKQLENYQECIEILLLLGADPQILTEENQDYFSRVFDEPISDSLIQLMKPILAYLSLSEACDLQVIPTMQNLIQSISEFKHFFELKKLECEEMKQIELGKSVTIFDLLIASDRQLSLYARNRKLTSISNNAIKNCTLDSSYQRKFQKNFVKFNHLIELRKGAATTVDEILSKVYNISVYIVAQKIIDFFEDHELSILL